MRLRFNAVPMDQPGRYFYLRDQEDGDFWSASWQPVGKDLASYKNVVRHGTAYSKFETDYAGIRSDVMYYVPLDATHEVWYTKVTNTSDKARSITLTGYAEFTNECNYEQDQVNLQYTLFITRTYFQHIQ